MLTGLIEEARKELHKAQNEADAKFDEYMTAPFDGNDRERELALDAACHEMYTAEGVLEGLNRAQAYLDAQARETA